ncbi:MAG: Uncharacterized protein CEO12_278 [Parcubacteria group bacterium Gr01-1014_46]|nr:MAG: Uncharacterized protein CEO12_278 [Parcubacteria group bacterium Gr01-1014_46]
MLSLLSFSVPNKTYAVYTDVANTLKEYGLDSVAYMVAKTVTRKLTTKTVNWINSGFKGNPGYIQNPDQFFLDVGDDLASQFLSQAGVNKLCSPFKAQVRLALVKNYIDDSKNYSCTLSILKNNYDAFTRDFSQGGWEGWFEVSQNSQNNPYGAYLDTKNELSIRIGTEREQKQKQIDLSGGFLNLQRCPKGMEFVDPVSLKKICGTKEETVTPGTVISDQLKETLGTKWGELVAADEFNEIITALVSQLIGQVAGATGGLFGASEKTISASGAVQPSLVDQIGAEAQPLVNYQIGATDPTLNCTSTGGGTDQYGNTTGGTTDCQSTPGGVSGLPAWPIGSGGSGGGSCPAYTPNPSHDCTKVDSGAVLAILNKYPPSNAGITQAEVEVKQLYPWAFVIPHARLDKFDFGNGMGVDVIVGAVANGVGKSWTWNVECACNRNPSGSPATNPPIPLPGVGTYLLTVDIGGAGSVTDNVDTCQNLSGIATTTCSKPYPIDSFVSVTAIPAVGRTFVGWSGACAVFNPSNVCYGNITMSGTIGATFR